MNDESRLAFEFARAGSEQLITLATIILGLSITFTKDVIRRVDASTPWLFGTAWLAYLLSIVTGVLHIWALTGNLQFPVRAEGAVTIQGNARALGMLQFVLFVLGTALIIAHGVSGLSRTRRQPDATTSLAEGGDA